jgi:membrane protein DedA with SNARE-associated domain
MSVKYVHDLVLIASQNALVVYLILYLLAFAIGDFSSLVGIWLATNGALNWFILIPVIVAASLTGDFFYYSVGHTLHDTKTGLWIKDHLPHHQEIIDNLEKRQRRLIALSKFIPFAAPLIFFSAGWIKVNIKKVFKYDLIALALWQPILILFGYSLARTFDYLGAQFLFKQLEILIGLAVVIIFAFDFIISRIVEKEFIE